MSEGSITVPGAAAIAVGGMMGAGLYSLLGVATLTAGVWLPVSFLISGVVAGFSVYSYAKLGAHFPSRGGAAFFLTRSFGDGLLAGGLNVFQFLSYIVVMALYAAGFAEYARALLPFETPPWSAKFIGVALIAVVVFVNLVGSTLVTRSELAVVGVQLAVLLAFVGVGLAKCDPERFSDNPDHTFVGLLCAAGLLYVNFQGFGVVTNSAGEMKHPSKQLPKAMFLAVGVTMAVYILVSAVVVMTMPVGEIEENSGHALAAAGRTILGQAGFLIVGLGALLATVSGVNATMFGSTNLAYMVAKRGQLPRGFTNNVWCGGSGALFFAAALTAAFVLFFPLLAVGQMSSLAFLLVYAMVSVGHLRVRHKTHAKAPLLWAAIAANTVLFALLMVDTVRRGPATTWIALVAMLALSFAWEYLYRSRNGRSLRGTPVQSVEEAATGAGRVGEA